MFFWPMVLGFIHWPCTRCHVIHQHHLNVTQKCAETEQWACLLFDNCSLWLIMMNNETWNDTTINQHQQTLKRMEQLVIVANSFVSLHTCITTWINLAITETGLQCLKCAFENIPPHRWLIPEQLCHQKSCFYITVALFGGIQRVSWWNINATCYWCKLLFFSLSQIKSQSIWIRSSHLHPNRFNSVKNRQSD